MSLTATEEERLQQVEEKLTKLFKLLDGAGSSNRLRRWYILLTNEIKKLSTRVEDLSSSIEAALELARKLQ